MDLLQVMGHCVRSLRYNRASLLASLDDLIFAHATGRGAIQVAQLTIQIPWAPEVWVANPPNQVHWHVRDSADLRHKGHPD